jgi:hypothetical protein
VEKPRSVCVRTFPSLPVLNPSAVIDTSFGAQTIATTSATAMCAGYQLGVGVADYARVRPIEA